MQEQSHPILGILGGLGPMSTVYFYELITSLTAATCDQEHMDLLISSRATTPDRTRFIIGESDENPLDAMIPDAKKLVTAGATMLAIPCNTAHYFYDALAEAVTVPILNIIEEAVKTMKARGIKRFALLATDGTVGSQTYQKYCAGHNIECLTPDPDDQARVMELIYGQIKQNKPVDAAMFDGIVSRMREKGAECIVLGCTELSLIKRDRKLGDDYIDPMECLAIASIHAAGKKTVLD